MGKPIKYSNDRSFDNLLLILMHAYMDIASLLNKDDISKNYIISKIDCLEDIKEAYFLSTEISQREWVGIYYDIYSRSGTEKHVTKRLMQHEFNNFHIALKFFQDTYHRVATGSIISEYDEKLLKQKNKIHSFWKDDLKYLEKSIKTCMESVNHPLSFKWVPFI